MIINLRDRINTMFGDLDFDSHRHLYFVNGENYPSVSSIVESFAPKFDEKKFLPYSAMKQSRLRGVYVSEEELKKEWKRTNEEACTLGTNTHEFLENYTGIETPRTPQEKAGVKFLRDMYPEWTVLVKELRGYSRKYKFAGTQDIPLQHKKTGEVVIADYKTNGDLFKSYDFLYPPFNFLESSPYNKYQIQLSLYQLILEEIGIHVSKRLLVYLKDTGEYRVFPLEDYTQELKQHFAKVIDMDNTQRDLKDASGW